MAVSRTKPRNQQGSYLIELLVALAISGLLAVARGTSVAQTKGISNRTENGLLATLMAQQVLDRVRNTAFDELPNSGVTHHVRVNLGDPDDTQTYEANQPLLNRPLLIDGVNLKWQSAAASIPMYKFRGTVDLVLKDGPIDSVGPAPVSKTATVTVMWSDSAANAPHVVQLVRMIYRYGNQRNAQT